MNLFKTTLIGGLLIAATTSQAQFSVVITEYMADPTAVSDALGEWIELHNMSMDDVDISGWKLMDPIGATTISPGTPLIVPPMGYLLFCRSADPEVNGGLACAHTFNFNLNNNGDVITLRDALDVTVAEVSYGNAVPGRSWSLDPSAYGSGGDPANWCLGSTLYNANDQGTPGAVNEVCITLGLSETTATAPTVAVLNNMLQVSFNEITSGQWNIHDASGRLFATGRVQGDRLTIPLDGIGAGMHFFSLEGTGSATRFVPPAGR